jgi:hypothetical protein
LFTQPGGFFGEECGVECRQKTSLVKIQKGNKVRIIAEGDHNQDQIAVVLNPDWTGRVKVSLGATIRAFKVEELEMVESTEEDRASTEVKNVSKSEWVRRKSSVVGCTAVAKPESELAEWARRRVKHASTVCHQCSVLSPGYSELLAVPREKYIEVATQYTDFLDFVNPALGAPCASSHISRACPLTSVVSRLLPYSA